MERKRKLTQKERDILTNELKVNPYRTVNDAFALMAIIPILVFFYIIVVKLFTINALIGSVGLLIALAIVIAIFGYLVTHDLINTVVLYAHRLRRSEMSKSKLVAILSHELNNPLTAIKGNIELLTEGIHGKITKEQEKALTLCYEMAERMTTLTDEILDSHAMQTGTVKVHRKECDLSEIIDEQEREFALRIEDKKILLKSERDGTNFVMWGSKFRISQVIHNLLGNAVKYTPESGEIDILLSSEKDKLKLSIHNNGPHIPKEELDNIFEHYKRLDTSTEGAGLGLAIVKDIVELHKGEVWAESDPEKGTTFTVIFPRDLRQR